MKNFRKLMLPLAMLVMLFSMAGSSLAQQEVFCLGLDEADCAIYTDFTSDQTLPQSTGFEANVAGNFDVPDAPVAFDVTLTGAYSTDVAAYQEAVDTFNAIILRDVNLGSVVDFLQGTISAWDAELFVDVSGTPELAMFTGGETIDLYIVDGVAYANLTPVANMMGDPSMEGVFGIDLFEVVNFGLNSVTMGDIAALGDGMGGGDPADLAELFSGDMMGEDNPFAMGFQQGLQGAAIGEDLTEEDIAGFASLSRAADEELNGETVNVFVTEINPAAVFAVDAIREIIIQSVEAQGEIPEEIDIEALIDGIAASVEGSTITVTEKYSEATGFLVETSFDMDFTVDPAPIAAAIGEELGDGDEPISFSIDFTFTRNSINAIDAITLPEGAQVVPFMELLGGF